MRGINDYAIVYDVSNNKERRKVDKVLKGFGFRIQESVFECKMNKTMKKDLVEKLNSLDIKTGFIKLYKLEYSSKPMEIGKTKESNIDKGVCFIV